MTLAQHARDLFDLPLTPEQVTDFTVYEAELLDWNQRMNLTAITEPDAIRVRHFLDSLSLVRVLDLTQPQKLVDIGAGAGFPGLPLAMLFPQVHVTLLDSVNKKVTFMQHVIDVLGLSNAQAVHARAELAGQHPSYREQFDAVLARAVARLPGLVEYMLPLAKVGGTCIAMKGTTAQDEAKSAAKALRVLGGELTGITQVDLPDVDIPHNLIAIKKTRPTPNDYPRRPGTPTREPIE